MHHIQEASNTDRIAQFSSHQSASGSDVEASSGDESHAVGESKKRKRSNKISCELCKARKVKCDKAEPSCGWCASHNRVCVYKERKRPGLRTSYELDLEAKVNRLEGLLDKLDAKVDDHIANHDAGPDSSHFQFRPTPASYESGALRTPTSTNDWQPAESRRDVVPHSRRPPTSDAVHSLPAATPLRRGESAMIHRDDVSHDTPQASSESDLPPYDLLYSLVDLYFKHVATWSPILDRKNTFDTLFGNATQDEPNRILLHSIVAVTLRFSKDHRLTPSSRIRYHDISKQRVQLYGLENPSIRALQALVILAIDILGTSNGSQGWNLLALIARNVVQLGLNVEKSVYLAAPPYPSISCLQAFAISQPTSWTENEARRRLFWMVYVLDRYTTVSTSFNFTLNDSEMDRPLPCSYDLFSSNEPVETKWFRGPDRSDTILNKPENIGSFAYHCEILRILSRIHKFSQRSIDINSVVDVQEWRSMYLKLDAELNVFLSQLPGDYGRISQLCHSDPASKIANWIMLHAAFVTSVIRLHAIAAYPTVSSEIFMPSNQAMQRCLQAVESLKAIAQDVVDSNGLDLLGPPFAFSLWVSARVLLVHAATLETSVDPKIEFFISTLHSMGYYWEVSLRYSKILRRLIQEHEQGAEGYSTYPKGKSFASMRRSAYDLSSLVSQRPSSVLDPTSTRLTSLQELEYLDVFDFFNYPKLSQNSGALAKGISHSNGADKNSTITRFIAPSSDSDWLNFRPPHE